MHPHANAPRAPLKRRLATLVYDGLVGLAVYMAVGALFFAIFGGLVSNGILPNLGHEHAIDTLQASPVYTIINELFKLAGVLLFFCYFWQKSGQTLGMRAWRIKVQNIDGSLISWRQGIIRAITSCFGLMNITLLFGSTQVALHDTWSRSEVVELTLEQNRARLGE